jgi:pimeloyl-ACP methyl ester carboxylesterase
LIAIRGPNGRRLAGTSSLEDGETVWRFVPTRPWQAGSYAVVTHQDLEDPAGNRPCAPFEVIDASRVRCEEERFSHLSRGQRVPFATPLLPVPTLFIHGGDDQIVPIGASAHMSSKLVRNALWKVCPGALHGATDTHKERLNADLLAFLKA